MNDDKENHNSILTLQFFRKIILLFCGACSSSILFFSRQ
jgi:hypothetical protein